MDEADVFTADFECELTESFQKESAFNVAYSATDFGDEDFGIRIGFGDVEESLLNLVGDMRNILHGCSEVFAFALVADDCFEDLAGGKGVEARELARGEALVVTKVEVGLGSVVEDVDFAMLVGRHCARIDIEIGIELLDHDLVATVFKQRANGGCGEPFPERGDDASGDKNVFHDLCCWLLLEAAREKAFEERYLFRSVESNGFVLG